MKAASSVWVFFNISTQEQSEPMSTEQAQAFSLQLKSFEMKNYVVWTPGWEKWKPLKDTLKEELNLFPTTPPPVNMDPDATEVIEYAHKKATKKSTEESTKTNSKVRNKTQTNSKATQIGEHTFTEIALNNSPPNPGSSEFQPDFINWDAEPTTPVLSRNDKPKAISDDERREFKRFPHRIEIVLMTRNGRSFRSSSQNISLGGTFLREPVPADLLREMVEVVVVNPFPDKQTPSHLLIKGRIVGDTADRRRLVFYDVHPEVQKKLKSILENYKKNYSQHKRKKAA